MLEETADINLNERETFWIHHYDSYANGYNNDYGGNGCRGYKHTSEEISRMRRIQNPNIVLQFDTNFRLIKRWEGGSSHISKTLGYTKECIDLRCKHLIKQMSPYKNSYWVFEEEYENSEFSWGIYFDNISLYDFSKPKSAIVRKICQYDLNRKLLKTWDSLADIRKVFGNTSGISAILHQRKGKKTAYGYIWTFDGYDFTDGYFDVIDKYYNQATENRKRKVQKIEANTKKY